MFRRVVAVCLFLTLVAEFPAFAYQETAQIQKLNIEIVEGEGAVNNIRQRMAREPMVQVTDENRKPVAGAAKNNSRGVRSCACSPTAAARIKK